MISFLTHIVTLVVFAVHAAVGCCAHHSHGGQADCCQQKSSLLSASLDELADRNAQTGNHHQCHHCGHDHHTRADELSIIPDASIGIVVELPCDHDSQCNGSRCDFVLGNVRIVDGHSQTLETEPWPQDEGNLACMIGIDSALLFSFHALPKSETEPIARFDSAAECCATHQSWLL